MTESEGFQTLESHLRVLIPTQERASLRDSVLPSLINSIGHIALALRTAHDVAAAGTANVFGDIQLNVDMQAENIIRVALAGCPTVVTASSEEDPTEKPTRPHGAGSASADGGATEEQYTVAFDPLDGSSIIAPNWSVGSIFGVWDGTTAIGQPVRERLVAAVLGVYGPRTTAIVALRLPGQAPACFEVGIGPISSHPCPNSDAAANRIVRPSISVSTLNVTPKTRYFAPANLRAAAEDVQYMSLVTHYISKKYTLRYSGGLVPDVGHMLTKGHGVYISPVTSGSKAKLRRLYEVCPVALVLEGAGGTAVDPETGEDVLDRPVGGCGDVSGLVCGTAEEVQFAMRTLKGAA